MDVPIRKAGLSPIAPPVKPLLACVPEALDWYPGFLGWFGRAMDEVCRGRRMLWTAETDGEPVGLLIAKQGLYRTKICCLGVHPLCRGCGIGGMLMEKAVLELGAQDIVLTVSDRMMPGMRKLLINFSFLYQEWRGQSIRNWAMVVN